MSDAPPTHSSWEPGPNTGGYIGYIFGIIVGSLSDVPWYGLVGFVVLLAAALWAIDEAWAWWRSRTGER